MINLPTLEVKQNAPVQQASVSVTQQASQESASVFETAKTEITSWLNDTDKVCEDGSDDGKLSFKEKAEYFGKGLLGIVKLAINHPIKTGLAVAAGIGLAVAVPIAGPIMCAAGIVGGGIAVGKGIYDAATAETDAEAKQAYETMGGGTMAIGAGVIGSKAALKNAGVDTEGMSVLDATKGCFEYTKSAASEIAKGGFQKGVYIDSNNKAHIASKTTISQQMDDVADSAMSDYAPNINSEEASKYLEFFGKYGEGVELNSADDYTFLQAHGSMQLYDNTAGKSLIQTYEHISKPLEQTLAWNMNNK